MNPSYVEVEKLLTVIEAEMKRLKMWQDEPLRAELAQQATALGRGAMTYAQYLQFIFMPKMRTIIYTQGQFPVQSNVGVQAVREYDTVDGHFNELMRLLSKFDWLLEHGNPYEKE